MYFDQLLKCELWSTIIFQYVFTQRPIGKVRQHLNHITHLVL